MRRGHPSPPGQCNSVPPRHPSSAPTTPVPLGPYPESGREGGRRPGRAASGRPARAPPSPRPSARSAAAGRGRGGPWCGWWRARRRGVTVSCSRRQAAGRLDGRAQHDRHAAGDAAEHAAVAVGARAHEPGVVAGLDTRSLFSLPRSRRAARSRPRTRTPIDRRQTEQRLGEVGLELVEDRLAEARPARRWRRSRPRRRSSPAPRGPRRSARPSRAAALVVGAAHDVRACRRPGAPPARA